MSRAINLEVFWGAVFKTVCVTCIPFTLYFTTASTLSITIQNVSGVVFIAVILFIFFCLYSLVGWLMIGLPLHWLITNQLNSQKIYYLAAIPVLWLGQFIWNDARTATITIIVAGTQLLLFLYWIKKKQSQHA